MITKIISSCQTGVDRAMKILPLVQTIRAVGIVAINK